MTKLIITIVLLAINIIDIYSQGLTEKEIFQIAQKNVFLCIVKVRTNNDSIIAAHASGFIIDSNYFATCNHLTGGKQDKIISMYVLSNLKKSQNKNVYLDTTYIDLTDVRQFDGSPSNDFIILKLKKPINIPTPIFELQNLVSNDTLYFSGFDKFNDKISCSGIFLRHIQLDNTSTNFLATISCADYGFSGPLVYNKHGKVIGLIDSGVDTYDSLYSPFNNSKLFPDIKHDYSAGLKISFLLESKYLLNNFILPFKRQYQNFK